MATMQELRAEAKSAGVPTSEIRSAESAAELQGLIAGYGSMATERRTTVVKKKTVAKKAKPVAKRGPGRPKGSVNKAKPAARRGRPPGSKNKTTTVAKRGPGRPKGSTNKTTAAKTTRKPATNGRVRNVQSTDGRHILSGINYSRTDGWNPRDGSAPDVILNALRRFKGDREKAFNYLVKNIGDFVGPRLRDGSKRSKASKEAMLRYRIARTDWDFALKTGQHDKSENRIEYGTGPNTTVWKPAKKSRKPAAAAPKRRGRPPGSKTTASAPKRRGRPPGSKNKPKTTTAARKTSTRKAPARKAMKRR